MRVLQQSEISTCPWGQQLGAEAEPKQRVRFHPVGLRFSKIDGSSFRPSQVLSPSAKGEVPRSVDFRGNGTLPPKVAVYLISGQQLDLLEKLGLPNAQVVTMKLFEHLVKVLIMPFLEENVLIVENRERNLSADLIINIYYVIEYMNYPEAVFVVFVVIEIFEICLMALFSFVFLNQNVLYNIYELKVDV